MQAPFRLNQHPRRGSQPLSSPPAGYFERLPTRVMTRLAPPARRGLLPTWPRPTPAALRTGLASTLLLGTFAATLWLGGPPLGYSPAAASLDGVPQEQLLDYLDNEAPPSLLDLAELPPPALNLTPQYLHPSATELAEALDAQPPAEVAAP